MSEQKNIKAVHGVSTGSEHPTSREKPTLRMPTFSSEQLFGNETEIGIEHDNLLYRLRITKQGKLILNK